MLNSLKTDRVSNVQDGLANAAREPVEVNRDKCRDLSLLLRSQYIPLDKEDASLNGFSRRQVGNFYFFLVAICHQTSPRGKPPLAGTVNGVHKRGWDYLSAKLEAAVRSNPDLLTAARWARITDEEFCDFFKDPQLGDRLTERANRAALVRNLGEVMLQKGWGSVEEIYRACNTRITSGQPNLIDELAEFKAYRDPVRKKSYFFLSLMRNAGLWHYIDNETLGPPVDYHEVRGHLRLGTVIVNDDALKQKLLQNLPVTSDEDIAIRRSVHDAIILISEMTGLRNPSQLHYLFWNVFRSCCSRSSQHCDGCPPDCALPERYVHLAVHSDGQRRCPFSDICAKTCGSAHQQYYEHRFHTDYY